MAGAASAPRIELDHITKRFGSLTAVDQVSLTIEPGTVQGLVGENGAGKTTLMRVLYGMTSPDSGVIRVGGAPVTLRSPRDALRLGIGMVHQHFMLIGELTILENIMLGVTPGRGPLIDRRRAREILLERAPGTAHDVDLDRPAGDLPPGEQQKVEILKLLYRDARVLILDEPTAVLPPHEAHRLFATIRRLAADGRSVVLITHKLLEVIEATDHVSVLRQGRLISSRPTTEATVPRLAEEIVGASRIAAGEIEGRDPSLHPRRRRPEGVPPIVELLSVTAPGPNGRGGLKGLSLSIYPGEILAVAGVEGNGTSELARVVAGRLVPSEGSLRVDGASIPAGRPLPSRPDRVGYIPEDRHKDGLVLSMTLERNLLLGRQRERRFRGAFLLDETAIESHARALIDRNDIRPPDPERPAAFLSGGNQQKAVVAREMEENPPLIVAAHPTRGLDLVATSAVHDLLRRRRNEGASVVIVTAELDEARLLGDRLVVLFDGQVAGDVDPVTATDEEIGLLMTGGGGR